MCEEIRDICSIVLLHIPNRPIHGAFMILVKETLVSSMRFNLSYFKATVKLL
jgi:hypothetical protein